MIEIEDLTEQYKSVLNLSGVQTEDSAAVGVQDTMLPATQHEKLSILIASWVDNPNEPEGKRIVDFVRNFPSHCRASHGTFDVIVVRQFLDALIRFMEQQRSADVVARIGHVDKATFVAAIERELEYAVVSPLFHHIRRAFDSPETRKREASLREKCLRLRSLHQLAFEITESMLSPSNWLIAVRVLKDLERCTVPSDMLRVLLDATRAIHHLFDAERDFYNALFHRAKSNTNRTTAPLAREWKETDKGVVGGEGSWLSDGVLVGDYFAKQVGLILDIFPRQARMQAPLKHRSEEESWPGSAIAVGRRKTLYIPSYVLPAAMGTASVYTWAESVTPWYVGKAVGDADDEIAVEEDGDEGETPGQEEIAQHPLQQQVGQAAPQQQQQTEQTAEDRQAPPETPQPKQEKQTQQTPKAVDQQAPQPKQEKRQPPFSPRPPLEPPPPHILLEQQAEIAALLESSSQSKDDTSTPVRANSGDSSGQSTSRTRNRSYGQSVERDELPVERKITAKERKKKAIGADEFVPIFMFVTVQACLNAPLFYAEVMSKMLSARVMAGEGGYYITVLCSALTFLEELNVDDTVANELDALRSSAVGQLIERPKMTVEFERRLFESASWTNDAPKSPRNIGGPIARLVSDMTESLGHLFVDPLIPATADSATDATAEGTFFVVEHPDDDDIPPADLQQLERPASVGRSSSRVRSRSWSGALVK
eukprot:c19693_g1_i2.p1 GENE.c19693_g1_i2~~c19693_g1_i2.p1  ORF type:complete len:821 (+),score=169.59 c19693_g1_i2:339-2465(+)